MAADMYTIFRRLIGDTATDYTIVDLELLKYLDLGIDRFSEESDNRVVEDITITASDISNGYITLSNTYVDIVDCGLGEEARNLYWQPDEGGQQINFIDTSGIRAGTYEFNYRKRYKTFSGSVRDNDYFDFSRRYDIGVVFWALSEYMQTKGIATVGDVYGAITNKSEEGISVSYGLETSMRLSSPAQLRKEALRVFRSSPSSSKMVWSISV